MVYQWKPLRGDREALELAEYMRFVIRGTGTSLQKIADAAYISRSALSQNCDGRWRQWHAIERWFKAVYAAAEALGIEMKISREKAMEHAHECWKVADARHREGRRHRRTRKADSAANSASPTADRRIPRQRPHRIIELAKNGPPARGAAPPAGDPAPPNQRRRPAGNPVSVDRPGLATPAPLSDKPIWEMITGRIAPTPELLHRAVHGTPTKDLEALMRLLARVVEAQDRHDQR
jgi:hypothetical protein